MKNENKPDDRKLIPMVEMKLPKIKLFFHGKSSYVAETSTWRILNCSYCGSVSLECKFWPRCKRVSLLLKFRHHKRTFKPNQIWYGRVESPSKVSLLSEDISNLVIFCKLSWKEPFKLTVQNQTLKPLIGVAHQDPSSQMPNLPKRIRLMRRPN